MNAATIQGLYDNWLIGICVFVTLVSWIQYALSLDRSYLWYGLYVLCNGAYFSLYIYHIDHDLPKWTGYGQSEQGSSSEFLFLAYISYYFFLINFLRLKESRPREFTIIRTLALIIMVDAIIHGILVRYLGDTYLLGLSLTEMSLIIVMPISFVGVYYLFKINTKLSIIIASGTLLYLVGSIGGFVRLMFRLWPEGIGSDFLLTTKFGFFIEIVCFSLGLAYRSTVLEREKQEAYRYKRLNELQSAFFTNISHEFRTPLTLIKGIANRIKSSPDSKTEILKQSDNLLILINQILDINKLEKGEIKPRYQRTNIVPVIGAAVNEFQPLATEKEMILVYYPESQEVILDFDPQLIQSISFNLINNAVKFGHVGGKIIVHLRAEANHLLWIIKDDGPGIAKEHLPHIFNRFYQAPSEHITIGSGIGLGMVKEYVELMSGTVNAQSKLNQGMEFTVRLPLLNTTYD